MFDKKLLGEPFIMGARDLIRLYFEIENKFNINLPQNEVIMGGFATLNSIAKIVLNEIKNNNLNTTTNAL
jgi:peptide maturation system acyl carrier-related protein